MKIHEYYPPQIMKSYTPTQSHRHNQILFGSIYDNINYGRMDSGKRNKNFSDFGTKNMWYQ